MGGGLSPPVELLTAWLTDRERYPYGERRGPGLLVLVIVLLVLTLVVVAARLWARCKVHRNAGLDDWLIVATVPFLIGFDACNILGFYFYGADRHAWEVTADQAVNVRIVTWVISAVSMLITVLTKTSILMFYRRLAAGSITLWWLWIVRGFVAFVVVYAVVFTTMLVIDCRPLNAFWNRMDAAWVLGGNEFVCFDEGADFIASTVVGVVTDLAVCILPLLVVRKLQMPRKQKWALSALFGVGFFLCFCGIMRVAYMYIIYYKTYDTTWEALHVWSWTLVEMHFAIICASAPALKLFFHRFLQATEPDQYGYASRGQRAEYDHFGSNEREYGGGPSRGKGSSGGGGGGDVESVYMADMLAFRDGKEGARVVEEGDSAEEGSAVSLADLDLADGGRSRSFVSEARTQAEEPLTAADFFKGLPQAH